MKTFSALRKIDGAGRIVLPKDLRKELLLIEDRDYVELITEGDKIILRKYTPSCLFCQSDADLIEYNNKRVCRTCIEKMLALSDAAKGEGTAE